jgi:hypothetical protein
MNYIVVGFGRIFGFIVGMAFVMLFPFTIIILPFSVLLLLERYKLTKTAICVAVIESAVFWALFFPPLSAALFER